MLVRAAEAARIMGFAERTVRAHIRSHNGKPPRLPAFRDGRDWYVDSEDARWFPKYPSGRLTPDEARKREQHINNWLKRRHELHIQHYGEEFERQHHGLPEGYVPQENNDG